MQADPNTTGMALVDAASYSGRVMGAIALAFSMEDRFGDGANLYQYLQGNPWTHSDPMGLSSDPFDMVDEIIAEHRASSAAFLNQVGQGAKAVAVIAATIASYLPFPLASAAGELALAAMGEQSMEEAAAGIAMGLIPGGKLAKHFKKLTGFVSKMASAAWSAAKSYVGKGARFLWKASGLDLAWRAAKWVLRKGCGCFEAGTFVWTAAGPVAIEMLEVGDRVIAHDEKSGEMTLREVTRVYVRRLAPIVAVTVLAAGGQVETFPTTEEHPFLVEAEETGGEPIWRRADHLKPGDLVRTLDRGTARVESITYTDRATTVYNLEVEGLHNYHVGEGGVVVHNQSVPRLPDHDIITEGGISLRHNYGATTSVRGGRIEHGPAHLHLRSPDGEIRIGQNGKPLAGDRELTRAERDFVTRHLSTVRSVVDKIMRWHKACNID